VNQRNTDGPTKGCFVNVEKRMKHERKDGGEDLKT
jgi:hypothetical protein